EEWSADLDYVLALSLQQEANPPDHAAAEVPSAFWEYCCTKGSVPPAYLHERGKSNSLSCEEIIMLPCEFCEELYPAEDLILHQTGCNPASAFASFSKRSSPKPAEDDGLCAVGSKGYRFLSSSQPPAGQAEGDIVIPCEFCGIQLEEETIFHHQHHCELRPASPPAGLPPPQLLPPQANQERRDSPSPELPPRRPRHQG
ncbi:TRAD1 protein, partial [Galbula dea]|nr:TRAD1 protein [Galbula dea]